MATTQEIPASFSYERTNLMEALEKVFNGELPTTGEIQKLRELFGKDIGDALNKSLPLSSKIMNLTLDIMNVPRTLRAAYDVSAPLRQGVFTVARHPKMTAANTAKMLDSFAREKTARSIDEM